MIAGLQIFDFKIGMLASIVDTLSDWVTAFADLIVELFLSFTGIFWDGEALTLLGILALMSTAIGLVYLGLRFLLSLFPGVSNRIF